MVNRRAIAALSLPVILVLGIGLAAGVWETPARLYSTGSGPLSSTSVALPTVIAAGLVDGINPCAFTVLLLFVAAVTSMYRGVEGAAALALRSRVLLFGGAFILAIFLTYLTLGAGLLRGIHGSHPGPCGGTPPALFAFASRERPPSPSNGRQVSDSSAGLNTPLKRGKWHLIKRVTWLPDSVSHAEDRLYLTLSSGYSSGRPIAMLGEVICRQTRELANYPLSAP